MSPLVAVLANVFTEVVKKRLATKSTVEGAIVATGAATASGVGLDPSSLEGQVLVCLMALISIYRILKKEK